MDSTQTSWLEAEYLALCFSIEREATAAGFEQFKKNPKELRDHVENLASEGLTIYPNHSMIMDFWADLET